MAENPFLSEQKEVKEKNVLIDILQPVVIAIAMSVFLYMLIVTPNQVDQESMLPNLEDGDLLLTSKLHQWFSDTGFGESIDLDYDRGDVVVFQKTGLDSPFVKRIIALPGETVRISDGDFYVNDQRLRELYDLRNEDRKDGTFLENNGDEYTLKEDEFFLAGDNRNISIDSRNLGPIKRSEIRGRVFFRLWPLSEFGIIGEGKSEFVEQN